MIQETSESPRERGSFVLIQLDSDAIRQEVLSVLASLSFQGAVAFKVTGQFELL
jgi:hypothetical protein